MFGALFLQSLYEIVLFGEAVTPIAFATGACSRTAKDVGAGSTGSGRNDGQESEAF